MRIDKLRDTLRFYPKTDHMKEVISKLETDFNTKIQIFTKRDEFAQKVLNIERTIEDITASVLESQGDISGKVLVIGFKGKTRLIVFAQKSTTTKSQKF